MRQKRGRRAAILAPLASDSRKRSKRMMRSANESETNLCGIFAPIEPKRTKDVKNAQRLTPPGRYGGCRRGDGDTAREIIMINDDSEVNEMCLGSERCFVFNEKALATATAAVVVAEAPPLCQWLCWREGRVSGTNFRVRRHKNIIIVQLRMQLGVDRLL